MAEGVQESEESEAGVRRWKLSITFLEERECDLCLALISKGEKSWSITCCKKRTCNTCYAKLRDLCPFCNLTLDEIPEHIRSNTAQFRQHITDEETRFTENVAQDLQNEEGLEQGFRMVSVLLEREFRRIIEQAARAAEEDGADGADADVTWVSTNDPVNCGVCIEEKPGGWHGSCCLDKPGLKNGYCADCFPQITKSISKCITCFTPVKIHSVHEVCDCVSCRVNKELALYRALAIDADLPPEDRQMYQELYDTTVLLYN